MAKVNTGLNHILQLKLAAQDLLLQRSELDDTKQSLRHRQAVDREYNKLLALISHEIMVQRKKTVLLFLTTQL